jgi:tetratricopeptide (TPR) repeat protein
VITGNLARTPFAHLVLYIREHGLSGTLAVWPAGTSDDPVVLGDSRDLADRLYFLSGASRAGRIIEASSTLERSLLPLFQRADGPFIFYPDANYVGDGEMVQPTTISDLALVAAATRGPVRDDLIENVVGRLVGLSLRLRSGADPRPLSLLPREQMVVDVLLAGPASTMQLIEQSGLEPRAARKLLYLLTITKMVEIFDPSRGGASRAPRSGESSGTQFPQVAAPPRVTTAPGAMNPTPSSNPTAVMASRPPAAAALPGAPVTARIVAPLTAPPPSPPDSLSPEHRAQWDDLAARIGRFDEQTYYEMLGLAPQAPADAVREAYFELIKQVHPDRLPAPLLPLLAGAQRLFTVLTEAHETLTDDARRKQYEEMMKDGGGTPAAQRKLEQTVEATVEFQKAEVLRKSDLALAERHARTALQLDPEQADYHALLAWVLFERHPGEDAPLTEMLALVDHALKLHDKHDRAHLYRGSILRRLGREADAVKAFRRSVELNPKNVDAQREVRLAEMRAKKGGAPEPTPDSEETGKPARPRIEPPPKPLAQRDIGEIFKGLFGSKKK